MLGLEVNRSNIFIKSDIIDSMIEELINASTANIMIP